MTIAEKTEIKILRLVAAGNRTPAALKKALRKDARRVLNSLRSDLSLDLKDDGTLILTKRGAGRLRFAS